MQSSQSASENAVSFSMQSTPVVTTSLPEEGFEAEESMWDIWPYCWAIDGWDIACEQFENHRTSFSAWRLARFNRRVQEKFCREKLLSLFSAHWNRTPECEERDMKLV